MQMPPEYLAQETEILLLTAIIPSVRQDFIDVGAEQGSFARFLASKGLRGVLFEPLPKHQSALGALAQDLNLKSYSFAIDGTDGEAEFHIACGENGEELDHFHSLQRLTQDARVQHQKSIRVRCRSLNSLYQEGIIGKDVGILKIDTEGNDLRVLQGLGPVRADVIVCEFFTAGIYSGWTDACPDKLIKEAKSLGYDDWIAVRRRSGAELVSLNVESFTDKEWGNLIFFKKPIFSRVWAMVSPIIASADDKLFSKIESSLIAKTRRRWFSKE